MSNLSEIQDDIQELKAVATQILKNQTLMIAHLVTQYQKQEAMNPSPQQSQSSGLVVVKSEPELVTQQQMLHQQQQQLRQRQLQQLLQQQQHQQQRMLMMSSSSSSANSLPAEGKRRALLEPKMETSTPKKAKQQKKPLQEIENVSNVQGQEGAGKRRRSLNNNEDKKSVVKPQKMLTEVSSGSMNNNKQQQNKDGPAVNKYYCSFCEGTILPGNLVNHIWEHIIKKIRAEKDADPGNMFSFICDVKGCNFGTNKLSEAQKHHEKHPGTERTEVTIDNRENTEPLFVATLAQCYQNMSSAEKDAIYEKRHE